MLGIERLPVFIDLAYGIVGMYAGYDDTSSEGWVIPKYYAHNSLRLVKPQKYPSKVPKEALYGPSVPSGKGGNVKGVAPQVVVVTQTADGQPLIDDIGKQLGDKIDQLRRRMDEEKWRRKSEQRRRKEAQDEQEQEKRKKQSRSRPSGGGNRPSFLNDR